MITLPIHAHLKSDVRLTSDVAPDDFVACLRGQVENIKAQHDQAERHYLSTLKTAVQHTRDNMVAERTNVQSPKLAAVNFLRTHAMPKPAVITIDPFCSSAEPGSIAARPPGLLHSLPCFTVAQPQAMVPQTISELTEPVVAKVDVSVTRQWTQSREVLPSQPIMAAATAPTVKVAVVENKTTDSANRSTPMLMNMLVPAKVMATLLTHPTCTIPLLLDGRLVELAWQRLPARNGTAASIRQLIASFKTDLGWVAVTAQAIGTQWQVGVVAQQLDAKTRMRYAQGMHALIQRLQPEQ